MKYYKDTFMGNVGFEELKRYHRQTTDFGREIVNILNERAQVEQNYAKGLLKLGQRVSKASSLVPGSPLSNAWKTVGVEMEKEAELHRELGCSLIDDCVQPLSELTEKQLKPIRMMEQRVESSFKTWTDRYAEHVKVKKRLHVATRENESLIEQINGPRPKTDRDQQKLVSKQAKQEETLYRSDAEYYNSLLALERSRQEWENASFENCEAAEDLDDSRFRKLCQVIQKYADNVYAIPSKMKSLCRTIDEANDNLSPSKEISIISDKLKGVPYVSEQLLCDYYQENFSCQMSIDRRRATVKKLLECYINDCQKERQHRDGLIRLEEKMAGSDLTYKLAQSSAMLTFFDVIRYKLSCVLASIDGNPKPFHALANNVEQHSDKQGIMYSMLKLRPGESNEKMKNSQKNHSKTKSSKNHAPPPHSSHGSNRHKDHHKASNDRRMSAPATGRKQSSSSSLSDYRKISSHSLKEDDQTVSSQSLSNETSESNSVLCQCVAIYDYVATRDDELSIHEGDIISVYEKGADDWWKGEVNGRIGLFPANYIDNEITV